MTMKRNKKTTKKCKSNTLKHKTICRGHKIHRYPKMFSVGRKQPVVKISDEKQPLKNIFTKNQTDLKSP